PCEIRRAQSSRHCDAFWARLEKLLDFDTFAEDVLSRRADSGRSRPAFRRHARSHHLRYGARRSRSHRKRQSPNRFPTHLEVPRTALFIRRVEYEGHVRVEFFEGAQRERGENAFAASVRMRSGIDGAHSTYYTATLLELPVHEHPQADEAFVVESEPHRR